jgi:hypothetical protein
MAHAAGHILHESGTYRHTGRLIYAAFLYGYVENLKVDHLHENFASLFLIQCLHMVIIAGRA